MPELPEVETIKNALKKAVDKSNIIEVRINNNRFREIIPDDFAQKVTGARITDIRRVAKYVLVDLDNGYSIIWHFGMSGRVKIMGDKLENPEKHDHVIIKTTKGILVFNDARRFGIMTCWPTTDLKNHHLFKKTGIDPFADELDGLYLFNKLKNKKIPIKTALLDQSIINGIGNIYASEALYESGILPTRNACELSEKECFRLLEGIRKVLEKAIQAGGSTIHDYRRPDGSMGYFQNMHCVYNKIGQKCLDCICNINQTGGIKKIVQAGRSTFYCPVKQK